MNSFYTVNNMGIFLQLFRIMSRNMWLNTKRISEGHREYREQLAHRDLKVIPEQLAHRGQRVTPERLGLRDQKAIPGQLVRRDHQDPPGAAGPLMEMCFYITEVYILQPTIPVLLETVHADFHRYGQMKYLRKVSKAQISMEILMFLSFPMPSSHVIEITLHGRLCMHLHLQRSLQGDTKIISNQ